MAGTFYVSPSGNDGAAGSSPGAAWKTLQHAGDPAFGPPGGSAINCDGVQDSVIRNNLAWDNHKTGIALYRIDGGGGSTGNLVHSNTIHNASDGRWCLHVSGGRTGNTVRDNILLNDHPFRGAIELTSDSLPGFSSDWNAVKDRFSLDEVFLSLAQWQAATGQDDDSFVASTAVFEDTAAGDYTLAAGSAALDAGTAFLAPDDDLPGKHRPAGPGFDIGAYEAGACFGVVTAYGAGLAGSGGAVPALSASGCPDLGAAISVQVSDGLGGAPALLLVGGEADALPKWGGTVLVAPLLSLPLVLDGPAGVAGAGDANLAGGVPDDAALVGVAVFLQVLVADAGAPADVALSGGLQLEVGGAD